MEKKELMLDSQAAVQYVMDNSIYTSYYSIAKVLTEDRLSVQPIQISNYHKGKRAMSDKVSQQFKEVFGIEIADSHRSLGRPAAW